MQYGQIRSTNPGVFRLLMSGDVPFPVGAEPTPAAGKEITESTSTLTQRRLVGWLIIAMESGVS